MKNIDETPVRKPRNFHQEFARGGENLEAMGRKYRKKSYLCWIAISLLLLSACGTKQKNSNANTNNSISMTTPSVLNGEETKIVPTIPIPQGFELPDTRNIALPNAGGKPWEPKGKPKEISIENGESTIQGTIFGPDGIFLPGASVRVERIAWGLTINKTVVTDAEGKYQFKKLPGGHYRVRSWLSPRLGMIESETLFMRKKESHTYDFTLQVFEGTSLQGAMQVAAPELGIPALFKALLVNESVDENGIIQGIPIVGTEIKILPSTSVTVSGSQSGITDVNGYVSFQIACTVLGLNKAVIVSVGLTTVIDLPECIEVSEATKASLLATTTTTSTSTTTTAPTSSTTTSVASTTSSTIQISSFTPPYTAVISAGTYTSPTSGCLTKFERFISGSWVNTTITGSPIVVTTQARNFVKVGSSPTCTFTRVS